MMSHLAGISYHLPCPGTCGCTLRGKRNTALVNLAKKEGNVGKKIKPWQNPLGKAMFSLVLMAFHEYVIYLLTLSHKVYLGFDCVFMKSWI